MKYKTLGNSGLLVSRICLGRMSLISRNISGWLDQAGADAMINASVDAGVNFIDTANFFQTYPGRSQTMWDDRLEWRYK
jgi:aryl-alcohol dehydrogenase-like predicted oxidoreductase